MNEYKYIKMLNELEEKIEKGLIDIGQVKIEFNEIIKLFHEETNMPTDVNRRITDIEFELLKPLIRVGIKYNLD